MHGVLQHTCEEVVPFKKQNKKPTTKKPQHAREVEGGLLSLQFANLHTNSVFQAKGNPTSLQNL